MIKLVNLLNEFKLKKPKYAIGQTLSLKENDDDPELYPVFLRSNPPLNIKIIDIFPDLTSTLLKKGNIPGFSGRMGQILRTISWYKKDVENYWIDEDNYFYTVDTMGSSDPYMVMSEAVLDALYSVNNNLNEIKRLQQLAGINEFKLVTPRIPILYYNVDNPFPNMESKLARLFYELISVKWYKLDISKDTVDLESNSALDNELAAMQMSKEKFMEIYNKLPYEFYIKFEYREGGYHYFKINRSSNSFDWESPSTEYILSDLEPAFKRQTGEENISEYKLKSTKYNVGDRFGFEYGIQHVFRIKNISFNTYGKDTVVRYAVYDEYTGDQYWASEDDLDKMLEDSIKLNEYKLKSTKYNVGDKFRLGNNILHIKDISVGTYHDGETYLKYLIDDGKYSIDDDEYSEPYWKSENALDVMLQDSIKLKLNEYKVRSNVFILNQYIRDPKQVFRDPENEIADILIDMIDKDQEYTGESSGDFDLGELSQQATWDDDDQEIETLEYLDNKFRDRLPDRFYVRKVGDYRSQAVPEYYMIEKIPPYGSGYATSFRWEQVESQNEIENLEAEYKDQPLDFWKGAL